ncbi:MAG: DUF378 domain-containing protein [Patescibacteria group bacterium]
MIKNKTLYTIAFVLVIIGGLNWGLVGLFNVDLVQVIFGSIPWLAEVIYTVVGVATVYLATTYGKTLK